MPGKGQEALCWSPRVYDTVRYMGLYQAGAGAYIGLYVSRSAGFCKQTRGSARWALPLFVLSAGQRPGEGAPVRVPPAGGPRPTRPSGLRAVTLPTLCGGGAAARPACLRQSGKCGGWSPPPSRLRRQLLRSVGGGSGLRACGACQPPAVARATRARRKAKPASGPLRGPCPGHSPRSVAA